MKKTLLLILIINSSITFGMPKRLEVWFLSINKTSWLDNILDKNPKYAFTAQRKLQCQQMGEYCFDPQVGLYKQGEQGKTQEEVDLAEIDKNQKYEFMDPHRGAERNLIECDKNSNFFDIFCGKSKKQGILNKSKLEIWVDVSSTMKQVDFDGFSNSCNRERFLRKISKTCPLNEKLKVYYFEESRKEAGAFDRVCLSGGLNNMKRIMQDVRKSTSDNIIIVTDIFEAEETFLDSIESTGVSVIKGLNKPMYAADMKKEIQRIQKICQ